MVQYSRAELEMLGSSALCLCTYVYARARRSSVCVVWPWHLHPLFHPTCSLHTRISPDLTMSCMPRRESCALRPVLRKESLGTWEISCSSPKLHPSHSQARPREETQEAKLAMLHARYQEQL